jgi:hypothetical protein
MRVRKHRHGEGFRQVFVDCGGSCVKCGSVDGLELHEPFGEDKKKEGKMQRRIVLCNECHRAEHPKHANGQMKLWEFKPSILSDDMDLEIYLHGGVEEWIKDFNLIDRWGISIVGD